MTCVSNVCLAFKVGCRVELFGIIWNLETLDRGAEPVPAIIGHKSAKFLLSQYLNSYDDEPHGPPLARRYADEPLPQGTQLPPAESG